VPLKKAAELKKKSQETFEGKGKMTGECDSFVPSGGDT